MAAYNKTMNYQFTAAAERALHHAAGWIDPKGSLELDSLALLLGLLAEDECRAAHLLAKHCVAMWVVCEAWDIPEQSQSTGRFTAHASHFANELNLAFRKVYRFASDFEPTPVFATEHLLLAILYCDNKTTQWLINRGISCQTLENDIRTRSGFADMPLEIDEAIGDDELAEMNDEVQMTNVEDRVKLNCPNPDPLSPVLRLLDAAANRAREGLRVIEDFLRFVLDDRFLTETVKNLRHDLVAEIKSIPAADLLASRETQADVGTGLTTAAESARTDLADVVAANFGRIQESLRSLEEYGKLLDPTMAAGFKQIRYRIYTLQRAVEITWQSCERLAEAKLYVLIDGRNSLDEFCNFVSSLIAAGVNILQLRDKKLDDRQLLERARALRELTHGTRTLFIMNDRPDLAALSRADGVHLGQEELSVKDTRSIVGPQMLIGVSTHSIEQARQAVLDGANYIGVGPTFPSTTKNFAAFPGLDLLRQVSAEIRLPAFAIGGITLQNLPEVLTTGIGRVAVSGAITNVEDPSFIVRNIMTRI